MRRSDIADVVVGSGLFEGPTWDGDLNLYFSNVTQGGVYQCDTATGAISQVVPKRRGIGGLALTGNGGVIVTGRELELQGPDGGRRTLFENDNVSTFLRGFNDLTVGPSGSIIVGSLGEVMMDSSNFREFDGDPGDQFGHSCIFEWSHESGPRQLADDIGHVNGIGLSPDGSAAYASDSLRRVVYRFVVRGPAAEWSERQVVYRSETGRPDGLAVDQDGRVWVAVADSPFIVVVDAEGGEDLIELPMHAGEMPTSLCFGGSDLRDVFITTASPPDPAGLARVVTFRSAVPGSPVPRARL